MNKKEKTKMNNSIALCLVQFFLVLFIAGPCAGQDDCREVRCSPNGPPVRYPFRLKDRQPNHCGHAHPGFELACTQNNETMLLLPNSVKLLAKEINYTSMQIRVSDPTNCLPRQLQNLDISAFEQYSIYDDKDEEDYFRMSYYYKRYGGLFPLPFVIFNCSSKRRDSSLFPVTCLEDTIHKIYAVDSDSLIESLPIISCTKMYNFSVPLRLLIINQSNGFLLDWSKTLCGNCDKEEKICKLNNHKIECYVIPASNFTGATSNEEFFGGDTSNEKVIGGPISGLILMVVLIASVLYHLTSSEKRKKEDQARIEKFLEDYKALKPTRYSYADIKKITSQFKERLGQGGYGTVYKGKISDDILVAVKVLNFSKGNGEEFINEVGTIGRIHHVNVVRLVGYCADGVSRALVYEFLPNDSLEKYLPTQNQNHSLTWDKLQNIALGIAKGIEYLHQGCDQRILHFDIKPHNVLLDHNFNPKISDFGLAKLCSKERSTVSMTAARGTIGYIAPEVFSRNFGNVSYKSDVYSFGMLLLEMVGVKKSLNVEGEDSSQGYFPEWIYNCLDRGEELEIQVEKEGDLKIAEKLIIVGLWCIQWYPIDRPSMKVVIHMLQSEDGLDMPPNPFGSSKPKLMPGRIFHSKLEVISE